MNVPRRLAESAPVAPREGAAAAPEPAETLEERYARMAHAYSRLAKLDGGDRVVAAMRTHPDLIRGPAGTDTRLMKAVDGWIAKGGHEGLLGAAGEGFGVALKSEDGNSRALGPAAAAFFAQLDLDLEHLAVAPIENSRGEIVGDVRL